MWGRHTCALASLLRGCQIPTLWARLGLNTNSKHLQAVRGTTLTQWSHLQTASARTAVRCRWLIGSTNIKQEGVWLVTHCVFKYVYPWMRRGRVTPLSLNPKGRIARGIFPLYFYFLPWIMYIKFVNVKDSFAATSIQTNFKKKKKEAYNPCFWIMRASLFLGSFCLTVMWSNGPTAVACTIILNLN